MPVTNKEIASATTTSTIDDQTIAINLDNITFPFLTG